MIPIGDENRGARGVPVVVTTLVVLNVLVYLYEASLPLPELQRFITHYGAIPLEISHGRDLYTIFTSMFVHGGLAHVAGNMLFLWIFGDNIERRFGSALFLLFYLGCGLVATWFHVQTNPNSLMPTVGASGAISGVMGAYILLYPFNRVELLIGWWFVLPVPAFVFLGIWFLTQLSNGMLALSVPTAQSSGVAFWAHIGGFAAGVLGTMIIAPLRPEPPTTPPPAPLDDGVGWL